MELEVRGEDAQFAECTGFDLANALARDAEPLSHRLECVRLGPAAAEAELEHLAHARVQPLQRTCELAVAKVERSFLVRLAAVRVFDQLAEERFAVADARLETDGILEKRE